MIYAHQRQAIDCITQKFFADAGAEALLISGSIAHGFNSENSDVDLNIVVTDNRTGTYYEPCENFYPGGYFDGKFITTDYLALVAERGNEPTRFALHDAIVAFDRTGRATELLKTVGAYGGWTQANAIRLLSQFDAWNWYCGEALKRNDRYLLYTSVVKLILFGGRLLLAHNKTFFPYHKWFMRTLEGIKEKPSGLMPAIENLLAEKSADNILNFYSLVKNFKDWSGGEPYIWSENFLIDTETVWMRQDEFIENI